MIDNIRNLWNLMLLDTRQEAIESLQDYYGVKRRTITDLWISKREIPENKQAKIVSVFQNALIRQEERIRQKAKI